MIERAPEGKNVNLSAATYNRIAAVLSSIENKGTNHNPILGNRKEVKVQNETGSNIDPHVIVQIGDPVVKPGDFTEDLAYKWQHVFLGEESTETTDRYGITLEGIPVDIGGGTKGVGRLAIDGIATAVINVTDLSHKYAKPTSTAHELVSTNTPTRIRILYAHAVGSAELCKVMIGELSEKYVLFPIDVTWTGGSEGSASSAASWRYDIRKTGESGVVIADLDPTQAPHRHERPVGPRTKAKYGTAFYDDTGRLIVDTVREEFIPNLCNPSS